MQRPKESGDGQKIKPNVSEDLPQEIHVEMSGNSYGDQFAPKFSEEWMEISLLKWHSLFSHDLFDLEWDET